MNIFRRGLMAFRRMKYFWGFTLVFLLVFGFLLSQRTGYFGSNPVEHSFNHRSAEDYIPDRNIWKNISQNGRKIGVAHTTFFKTDNGYRLHETLHLRINTMGVTQNISLETSGRLRSDYSLAAFDFEINSGRFQFVANGFINRRTLTVITRSSNKPQKHIIKIPRKIYLSAGIVDAMLAKSFSPDEVRVIDVFDPASMSYQPVKVSFVGEEPIKIAGKSQRARKISFDFKGMTQFAWVNPAGEIIREQGLMGITLEKTTREDALFGLPLEASEDLTRIASVSVNRTIDEPHSLKQLKVKISGISLNHLKLDGGRQQFKNSVLTVSRETLSQWVALKSTDHEHPVDHDFLAPSVFIQSDHPKIKSLAVQITETVDAPMAKIVKLVDWLQANIERKPVISLPDALSTLDNKAGDCNEHAMLFAALSRAVGIPSSIEAGLVYMNGRFYYHAWNRVYVGNWITVDALLGQIPADVTHLRFVSDAHRFQTDIMSIIGKVKLEIVQTG